MHPSRPPAAETADVIPGGIDAGTGPESWDAPDSEALMLNLDASLRVHERAHFFTWTQGLLQSLIRHEVLVCVLRNGEPFCLRVDSFSTVAADPKIFREAFLRDASLAPNLIKAWEESRFRPVVCETGDGNEVLGRGAFARELERVGASRLFVHGTHDADGQMCSLFVFCCTLRTAGLRHPYLAQLAVPFLHSAWVRTFMDASAKPPEGQKPTGASNITSREREILKWIFLGKSNIDIGAILNISPLTVKNHVQKVLRKLNVVNRAQAIGKALELRILKP